MLIVAPVSLSLLQYIFGAISAAGCVTVITTYWMFPDIRCLRYVELVYYVAINDLIASIGVALGNTQNGSPACWFQGLTSNINYLSSIMWTTVISYQLWLVVHKGVTLKDMRLIHLICWGFPILVALLPLSTGNTYGNVEDSNTWCFINNGRNSPSYGLLLWEILSFYAWVWLAIIGNLALLFNSRITLSEILVAGNADPDAIKAITTKINKLIWYPRMLIFCWAAATVIDLVDLFHPPVNKTGYQYANRISTVLAISQGWLLAVAFFAMNPIIRYKWKGWFYGKPQIYKANNQPNSYTFDIDDHMRDNSLSNGGGTSTYSLYSVEDEPDYVSWNFSDLLSLHSAASGATTGRGTGATNTNDHMRHTLDGNFEIPTMDTLDSSGDVLYPGLHLFRSSRLFSKDKDAGTGATVSGRNSTSSSVRGNKSSSVSGYSDTDSDVESGTGDGGGNDSDRGSFVSSTSYTASGHRSIRSSRMNSVASTNSIVNNPIQAAMSPSSGGIIGRPVSAASSAGASSYHARSAMATHMTASGGGSRRGNTGGNSSSDANGGEGGGGSGAGTAGGGGGVEGDGGNVVEV